MDEQLQLIQQTLIKLGFSIDQKELLLGRIGETTKRAVFSFQESAGLRATGELDKETVAAVRRFAGSDDKFPDVLKRFDDQAGKLDKIDDALGGQGAQLGTINAALGAQGSTLQDIQAKFTAQNTSLGGMDTKLGQHTEQFTGIDAKLGSQLAKLDGHTTQFTGIDAKLTQHATQFTGIDGKLGDQLTKLDAQTAKLTGINDKLGALSQVAGAKTTLALNARGDDVKDLHGKLGMIGLAVPSNELQVSIFGVGTRDALLQLQGKYQLALTGILDDATRNALSIAVGGAGFGSRIEGRVYLENGLPAGGVTLRIYDRGFGDAANKLGDVTTDMRGFYALPYVADGANGASTSANLELRLVDAAGHETVLNSPKLRADRNEVLNIVAPASTQTNTSEYTLLAADLVQHAGDVSKLATAREDTDRHDLQILHGKTGWDARFIAVAAQASQASTASGIAHDALYGALRVGLPADAEQLAQVTPEAFSAALMRSNETGITQLSATQLDAAKASFGAFITDMRRKEVTPGALSSTGSFLDAAGLNQTQKTAWESLVLTSDGPPADVWQQAKDKGIPDAQIKGLQLQGKLAYLTLNNASLAQALQGEIGTLENVQQIVDKDLYQKEAWVTRLKSMSNDNDEALGKLIPPAYTGATAAERLDAYAEDLAGKVRRSYPTQIVNRMLSKDELPLGDAAQHAQMKAPTQALIKNVAALDFKLGRVPVDQFINQNRDAALAGIAADQQALAIDGLKTLQRVSQVTPDDKSMQVLMTLGFTSAWQVAAIDHDMFVDRYWDKFGSREVAHVVHTRSHHVSSVTHNVFTIGRALESAPPVGAVSGTPEQHQDAKDRLKSLLKDYPTMESLFGSLDFCDCEHCRSVLSPAAYLVDLLKFIDPDKQIWDHFLANWKNTHNGKDYGGPDYQFVKPFDALVERRPDLPNLPLTCENTNTAMPYIDLVNEILEYYVANGTIKAEAVHDTGEATTPDLLAEPQFVVPKAYENLKAARYPLSLPFDLWLESSRRFFEHFDAPLSQVLETFRPKTELELFAPAMNPLAYYRADIFTESLGLSPDEVAVLTLSETNAVAEWFKLFGIASEAAALAELSSAKSLSRRLGVSYVELTNLVRTAFINPQLDALVTLRKLNLDADDVFRYKGETFSPGDKAEFETRLDALTARFASSGFNARTWLDTTWMTGGFNRILLLHDPDAGCSFDETTLQFADGTAADRLSLIKFNLFVRLWKKLGWTMEETDRALSAFIPANAKPLTEANIGQAMRTALIYLAHLQALDSQVSIGKNSRMRLLTMWSPMSTTGKRPLYAQLFLTRNIVKDDPDFDDPLGNYLSKPNLFIKDHLAALQAALGLTAGDVTAIIEDMSFKLDAAPVAPLNMTMVSALYRYGLLAKALKLSVPDLIALKALSGLDPFKPLIAGPLDALDKDYPFTQTLEFVRIALGVADSGFKVEDVQYLLRHRFDPVGKYRVDPYAAQTALRMLASDLRQVQADYAVPADAGALTDDALRAKMALAFTPDVVERFMGFWQDTLEFSQSKDGVLEAKRLSPTNYVAPALRVSYDATRQRQQVTHIGVLTGAKKAAILAAIPEPAAGASQDAKDAYQNFTELLDKIEADSQPQFAAFFLKHFDGLLTYNDFYGAPAAGLTPDQKRLKLLQVILPFLRKQIERQHIVQALATQTGGDPALIEALLTRNDLLALPDTPTQPLLEHFGALAGYGLTAEFFASTDLTGGSTIMLVTTADLSQAPAGTNSARFRGTLEVVTAGPYRFYARLGKANTEISLRFDGQVDPLINATATRDDDELGQFAEFKPGVSYAFTLEVRNLQAGAFALLVKGDALPKDKLSQLTLTPQAAVDVTDRAQMLLQKALQLLSGFGLNEREVRYILSHPADFSNITLGHMPVRESDDSLGKATALFAQFVRLADYATAKRDLAGGGDDLIGVFENARSSSPETVDALAARLAAILRRIPEVVRATATTLGMQVGDFAADRGLGRLWEALQIVEKLGVPIEAITRWRTPQPDYAVAKDLRDTVKARYEPEAWQRIAQSIFDPLRQKQRDALVAHILHTSPFGFERAEQLFEHFLIDTGMEPVVQTSRLRLAISALQTFIQRCFLNLEKKVHPSALNAKHWEWMKRYRVWEANRKIFLFPENWLEPEWRDDKTHLFKELEGTLLQGDVTNDLAEGALFTYLKKLDQIAKLEIVTMYVEEKPLGPPTIHVIGRTQGPRQYFYRQYAHHMWTPWEPVPVDIEGDHLVLVMWRERLHLFWATFMEKIISSDSAPSANNSGPATNLTFDQLASAARTTATGAVKRQVDVQLSWSEYFQGEWTARETGGFGNVVNTYWPFDPSTVFIHVSKEYEDRAVLVNLDGLRSRFRVVSKNSPPRLEYVRLENIRWSRGSRTPYTDDDDYLLGSYNRYIGSGKLRVTFVKTITTTDTQTNGVNEHDVAPEEATLDILQKSMDYALLAPGNPMLLPTPEFGALISPIFYQDDLHTFFVEPTLTETTIDDWDHWVITKPSQRPRWDDWVIKVKDLPLVPQVPRYVDVRPGKIGPPVPDPIDPLARFKRQETKDWMTKPDQTVRYAGRPIGPAGGVFDANDITGIGGFGVR